MVGQVKSGAMQEVGPITDILGKEGKEWRCEKEGGKDDDRWEGR